MSLVAFRHYLTTNPTYLYCLLKHKARQLWRQRWVDAYARSREPVPPPLVYKLVLTDRCNLACKMCMQVDKQNGPAVRTAIVDVDFDLVDRLIADVAPARPSIILSGGEPMLYPRFADLIELLERKRMPTNICTNGTLIAKHLALFKAKRYIQLTISLDGMQRQNDAIRGDGVHDSVVSAIHSLRRSTGRRIYIGVQHTIRPENVASIHAFCKEMVALDVDWILLNPCWHLSREQAGAYGSFMRTEYGVVARSQAGYVMDCAIDVEVLAEQMRQVRADRWPIQISCYYRDPAEHLRRSQSGPCHGCSDGLCYKQWVRMDIMPDGKVVSCQQYPDLVVGDLHRQRWQEVWNGEAFRSFRDSVLQRPLPVCEHCAPFYLYDRKRLYL